MPTHHACAACGYDLSRLRAPPDPHYGLPVVVCPGCALGVVRRRDAMVSGWRQANKAAVAVAGVAVQALVFGLVCLLAMMLVSNIGFSARRDYGGNPLAVLTIGSRLLRSDEVGPDLLILTVLLVLLGLFAGVWTRSSLAHVRPWWVWGAWAGIPVFFSCLAGVQYRLWELLGQPTARAWGDRGSALQIIDRVTAGAMFGAFMLAGFPLGRWARGMWRAGRVARWSKRRKARRRLREDR